MLSLAFRTFEFLFYHLLIVVVDRVSRLPRGSNPPEVMRLYRENLALKAQNGALLLELDAALQRSPEMTRPCSREMTHPARGEGVGGRGRGRPRRGRGRARQGTMADHGGQQEASVSGVPAVVRAGRESG